MLNSRSIKEMIQRPIRALGFEIVKFKRNQFWKYEWLRQIGIGTILDVGANEGQFAKEIRPIFPGASLYCFEPLKECFQRLESFFRNDPTFVGFNLAVSDREGQDVIYRNEFAPASSLLQMTDLHREAFPYTKKQTKQTVRLARLDDLLANTSLRPQILLKVDVQGSELAVLGGGKKILDAVSVIIIETNFQKLYEGQATFEQVFDVLRERGFIFKGFFDQLLNPADGMVLQGDAIFVSPGVRNQSSGT